MSQAKATTHLEQGAAVGAPTVGVPLRTFSPTERERISEQLARIMGVQGAPAQGGYVDIVFDGPPEHEAGRFVEVENEAGESIRFGKWIERPDGYWALRIKQAHTLTDNFPHGHLEIDPTDDEREAVEAINQALTRYMPGAAAEKALHDAAVLARRVILRCPVQGEPSEYTPGKADWLPVTSTESGRTELVDNRDPECVKAWPGCHTFGYDPACCRFPKSCSAGTIATVTNTESEG